MFLGNATGAGWEEVIWDLGGASAQALAQDIKSQTVRRAPWESSSVAIFQLGSPDRRGRVTTFRQGTGTESGKRINSQMVSVLVVCGEWS